MSDVDDGHASPDPPHAGGHTGRGRPGVGAIILAVLVLLTVGAGIAWWLDVRAERETRRLAATELVRDELAERYDALESAAVAGADAAAALRLSLQEHLTVSERSDEQLAADRVDQQEALTRAAERLAELAAESPPEVPDEADAEALDADLATYRDLQSEATALAGRMSGAATASQRWADALAALREQADRYVTTVEGQPETHDPDRLADLWREEREVLADYRAAAEAAQQLEGLAPLAEAYLEYIAANLEFIAHAIELLEQGRIDDYNARLAEVFGQEDPFGFQAAVAAATEPALSGGVTAELADIRSAATDLVVSLEAAQARVTPAATPSE